MSSIIPRMVRERPILFSAPMVRAILDGTKTQTRRVLKKQPIVSQRNPPYYSDVEPGDLFICPDMLPTGPDRLSVIAECTSPGTYHCMGQTTFAEKHSPYGVAGDRLWVRETWQHSNHPLGPYDDDCLVFYRADYLDDPHGPDGEKSPEGKYRNWRPSIHMPRTAARTLLDVTGVRIERLNSISDQDCIAEGIGLTGGAEGVLLTGDLLESLPRAHFRQLWESISGPGSWDANPWVWVVEFQRAL
ncbi:hypothetical protein [Pandoraea bronchicola]|uniref:Uncharacterized protein n=1 Tax=Pandoraea bronchicola TaxID=2508287 RepID=A0A5E5BYV2_9BURK|nr:hypothetical protein [Pandoraea bronchicola]VVE90302.1 hypothetical protein PBR20603_04284 [Pandoraea bronchicola]